jgi:hypothetical protein
MHKPALTDGSREEAHVSERNKPPRRSPRARLLWFTRTVFWWSLLALGLTLLIQQVARVSQLPTDFCQDHQAAWWFVQGASVYQPVHCWSLAANAPAPLEYDAHPPSSIAFFLPFGLLPRTSAEMLWGALSLAAYLLSGWLLLREIGWHGLPGMAIFTAGSVLWTPLTGAEQAQNLAQVLTLLIVLAWLLERKGCEYRAGWLLGLGGALKLWPAALLPGAIARGRWREALTGGIALLASNALALLLVGPAGYSAYLGPIQDNERYSIPNVGNISLVGLIARPLTGDHVAVPPLGPGIALKPAVLIGEAVAALCYLGVLTLIWRWNRYAPDEAIDLLSQSSLITITLLAFPLTWHWGLISLLIPGAMLILALRKLPRPPRWWFVLFALGLLPLLVPFVSVRLVQWLIERPPGPPLLWLEHLTASLPAIGLLLFTAAQLLLLRWALLTPRQTRLE